MSIRPTPHVRKALAQRLCVYWPNAVVEDDIVQPLGPDSLLRAEHVFVYEDRRAFAASVKGEAAARVELLFHKNTFEVDGHAGVIAALEGLFT